MVIILVAIINLQYVQAEPDNISDLKVKIFGLRLNAEAINDGFLFIDNEYIDAPYKVTSKGLGIFVNNRLVDRIHLPPYYGLEDADPVMPTNITKNTSRYDPVYKKYMSQKFNYIEMHYPNQQREKKLKVYQNLPNIRKIELDDDPNFITIHTYKNGTFRLRIVIHARRVNTDFNSLTNRIENLRHFYSKNLKEGDVKFVGPRGGMKMGFSKNSMKLSAIIRMCNENISNLQSQNKEVTACKLKLWPHLSLNLMTNLVASPQLDERIQELKRKSEY